MHPTTINDYDYDYDKKVLAAITPLPGAQSPGWVGIPDAQIIHPETLATDHHYPGALPPGWVGLSAAPILHLQYTPPTYRDLAYAHDFLF